MTADDQLRDAVEALISVAGPDLANALNQMHPDAPPLGTPEQRQAHHDRQRATPTVVTRSGLQHLLPGVEPAPTEAGQLSMF